MTKPPRVIAVANAKGGVGKTSIVANLAGVTALAGWRVLVIDLDQQGNLATDLGYSDRSDLGASLTRTLSDGAHPVTLREIRPGLDAWAGGSALQGSIRRALIPQVDQPLAKAIETTQSRYDFVYVDCPPALGPLVDAALGSAGHLLVPIRADHASLDGVRMIADRFRTIRSLNPALELMGVTMFDVSKQATAMVRETAEALRNQFGDLTPRFLPAIRRAERSAFEMRREGLLAHEYEERRFGRSAIPLVERIAAARAGLPGEASPVSKLSNDYFELTKRVLAIATADERDPRLDAGSGTNSVAQRL